MLCSLRNPDGHFLLKLKVRSVSVNKFEGQVPMRNARLKVGTEQFICVQQKSETFNI